MCSGYCWYWQVCCFVCPLRAPAASLSRYRSRMDKKRRAATRLAADTRLTREAIAEDRVVATAEKQEALEAENRELRGRLKDTPSPGTHAISTVLKAGASVFQKCLIGKHTVKCI